jgi:hypothetical protein
MSLSFSLARAQQSTDAQPKQHRLKCGALPDSTAIARPLGRLYGFVQSKIKDDPEDARW